jgi:Ca2+-binding EF-hand superfamily protein
MKKFTILAGIAALAVSGTAAAQTGGFHRSGDRNVDMTRAQAAAKADQAFQRLDLNRDGRVTRDEMRQAREQFRAQAQERRAQRLAQLTPEQRAQIEQRRAQRGERGGERAQRWANRGGGEARGQRGHRGGERMFGEQGFVTAEQFRARALERFDRMDLNNDGVVTAAERQQAREQMRQRWQERRGARS